MTEEVGICSECDAENVFADWDVKRDGYVAVCSNCGGEVMLCDACMHTDENGNDCECHQDCDWHLDTNTGESTCYRKLFKTIK